MFWHLTAFWFMFTSSSLTAIPESQELFLNLPIDVQRVNHLAWNHLKYPDAIQELCPSPWTSTILTANVIDMVQNKEKGPLIFDLRVSVVFNSSLTTELKQDVAKCMLDLEKNGLYFAGEKIRLDGQIKMFDSKSALTNLSSSSDAVDWCSLPELHTCPRHATCVDSGFRYTCPCNVGYFEADHECRLSVRLVSVTAVREGRLEKYLEGRWLAVCHQNFTLQSARVACRHLGFPVRGAVFSEDSHSDSGFDGPCTLQSACTGTELVLSMCETGLAPLVSNVSRGVRVKCDEVCTDDLHYGISCAQRCPCDVNNTASCDRYNGTCYCKAGWEGTTCDEDIDECVRLPGICSDACENTAGGYLCNDTMSESYLSFEANTSGLDTIAVSSAISVTIVFLAIIVVIVVWKKRVSATSHGRPRLHHQGEYDFNGVKRNQVDEDNEDNEVYDEIPDDTVGGDFESMNDGYSVPNIVDQEDENPGYTEVIVHTVNKGGEQGLVPLAPVSRFKSDPYLHPVSGLTPNITAAASDGYLHPITSLDTNRVNSNFVNKTNKRTSDSYLHPVSCLAPDNTAVMSENDVPLRHSDGYLLPVTSSLSANETNVCSAKTSSGRSSTYLNPVNRSVPTVTAANSCWIVLRPRSNSHTSTFNYLKSSTVHDLQDTAADIDGTGHSDHDYLLPAINTGQTTAAASPTKEHSDQIAAVLPPDAHAVQRQRDSYLHPISSFHLNTAPDNPCTEGHAARHDNNMYLTPVMSSPMTRLSDRCDSATYLHPLEIRNPSSASAETEEADDVLTM